VCPPSPGFPRDIMLIVGDTCWVEIDTTQAKCSEYIREERGWYMTWSGRCYFFAMAILCHPLPLKDPLIFRAGEQQASAHQLQTSDCELGLGW
jgi:hypothetical protein